MELYTCSSLILPAPNHLEWEFCCVCNVWVCMPLQSTGTSALQRYSRGDSFIVLFSSITIHFNSDVKSPRYAALFDLRVHTRQEEKRWDIPIPACGTLTCIGSCQIMSPEWLSIPSSPMFHEVSMSLKSPHLHMSQIEVGQSLSFPRSIRLKQHQSISSMKVYLRG